MIKKITMKFEKLFRLIKKAIHFAWYRHHFLIPPKALKKYIKSFFIVLKRGGNSANLFVNQKAYLKDDYNYVASLIDYFNVDFNYSYVFGENIKYDMDYEIVANLEVYDSDNTTKPIEKKEFQILEKTSKSGNGQVIKVDLYNQKIDYDTYNKIIQEWKKEVSPEATLKVDFIVVYSF